MKRNRNLKTKTVKTHIELDEMEQVSLFRPTSPRNDVDPESALSKHTW